MGTLYKWDLKTYRIVSKVSAHNGQSVLWLHSLPPDTLLSQGRDGLVVMWNISDNWQIISK